MNIANIQGILEKSVKLRSVLVVLGVVVGLKASKKVFKSILRKISNVRQMQKVKLFIAKRNAEIQAMNIPVNEVSDEILQRVFSSDIAQLKQMLEEGVITSEILLNIYASRCKAHGMDYHIITHLKYKEALEQARQCDALRKTNPEKCKSLLFGIPLSIKETFDEQGYPSTVGSIYRLDYIPKEDGYTVKLLKKAGAILFVRTNVPQAAMTFESYNAIYGRVFNPWDITKYAGGSSGGEGAAIGARLSPAGVGSDIGGSIRIPAAMCGVYGFKPTGERSAMAGHTFYSEAFSGQNIIPCASGPLGRSVEDLVLLFKAMSDPENFKDTKFSERDTHISYQAIDEAALNNSTPNRRFGYFTTTHSMEAAVCMQRGVNLAVEALRSQGHTVIEVNIPRCNEIHDAFIQIMMADGLQSVYDLLKEEPAMDEYLQLELGAGLPTFVKNFLASVLRLAGAHNAARVLASTTQISVAQYNRLNYLVSQLKSEVLKLFDSNQIEAIICPSFGAPALQHQSSVDGASLAYYTFLWNVVNFPAGVMPVTVVREDEQHFQNADQKDPINRKIDFYMKNNTKGLPVGIQVVAPPFREETCLNVMKLIEPQIKFYQQHKLPELNQV